MDDYTLVNSSFSSTLQVPIEQVDLPKWCFSMSEAEYQSCSPAHVSAGVTTAPDGRRMSINVEVIGGSPMVQGSQRRLRSSTPGGSKQPDNGWLRPGRRTSRRRSREC